MLHPNWLHLCCNMKHVAPPRHLLGKAENPVFTKQLIISLWTDLIFFKLKYISLIYDLTLVSSIQHSDSTQIIIKSSPPVVHITKSSPLLVQLLSGLDIFFSTEFQMRHQRWLQMLSITNVHNFKMATQDLQSIRLLCDLEQATSLQNRYFAGLV